MTNAELYATIKVSILTFQEDNNMFIYALLLVEPSLQVAFG